MQLVLRTSTRGSGGIATSPAQVCTRTKIVASTRYNNDSIVGTRRNFTKNLSQAIPHCRIDCILLLRLINRHRNNRIFAKNLQSFHCIDDTCHMGFNPTRKRNTRPIDYLIVASAMLAIAALVIWAFFG
jgi:hypothetical protein